MAVESWTNHKQRIYRVKTEENDFEITLNGNELIINNNNVPYVFEPHSDCQYTLFIGDRSFFTTVEPVSDKHLRVTIAGRQIEIQLKNETDLFLEQLDLDDISSTKKREVHAPMPGLVLSVAVTPGQTVSAGDRLVVLEAMKMENEIRAGTSGKVKAVHVTPGDSVSKHSLLIEFEI